MIDYLANPSRFFRITNFLLPWLMGLLITLTIIGIYFALFDSPEDLVQGSAVRIMYVHVPSAWLSIFSYLLLSICSFFFIVWRHPLADILSRSIAPVGALFSLLTLLTGSIWGRPMWGTWWVWDARLTSMLILFIFFLGYIALSNAFEKNERGSRPAALLAIVGSINLPIVKFSVDWWNTLHQPASIIRTGGISIDQSMLVPLIIMTLAFHIFFILVVILRAHSILIERKVYHLKVLGKI
jgi:heme exporter protein C